MTALEIVTYPDIFLRQTTKPVENIDGTIQDIIKNMSTIMYEAPGVGLAAIQVGCDKSIIVYDIMPGNEKRSLQVLVNPRVIEREGNITSEKEGCLSVPDFRSDVKRAESVLVEGLDRDGNPLRIEAEGYLSIVLQHEIDHLNGVLFIDHVRSLKKDLYTRRVKKQLKKKGRKH